MGGVRLSYKRASYEFIIHPVICIRTGISTDFGRLLRNVRSRAWREHLHHAEIRVVADAGLKSYMLVM